jgi:large subunit ribosomal protein L9
MKMKVILLEKIRNLGNVGSEVLVAAGYGRNFLLPRGKALLANPANIKLFANKRASLEEAAQRALAEAEKRAAALQGLQLAIPARVSDDNRLYGSIGVVDIVAALQQRGFTLSKQEVCLPQGALRNVGSYTVKLVLFDGVEVDIQLDITPMNTALQG